MAKNKTKNAGEWAELYALIKILADGKLFPADGEQNIIEGSYYPVVSIPMQNDDNSSPIEFRVESDKTILVKSPDKTNIITMKELHTEASNFFKIISSRKGRSFSVPEIEPLLDKLQNPTTKQSSDKKADIHICLHDINTGQTVNSGFSIKSRHSKPATLLNASKQTLFRYRVVDKNSSKSVKESLATYDVNKEKIGSKTRVQNLNKNGYDLEFEYVVGESFSENLTLIDSSLALILSECLKFYMNSNKTSLSYIVEEVAKKNPCGFKARDSERIKDFYIYKVKRLLIDAALGMMPSKPWKGQFDASGGYIIVKEAGDIVCYHIFSWNAFQDYLFNNLKFEAPSSTGKGSKSSFNYALPLEIKGIQYMDICLQIRFKK
ncbi:HpaII family restriction endonuclease [Shewanella sp. UCD-KL12]|uniref:HpaII family restriction endonuclease n=1 Tax=Shewanella sp. UCD-KL12 TaxID=1917163 RepID=UPI0009711C01|nr:HpaII family restriction endonuclease [Shewanella sp. UCD-KL12]